MMTARVTNADKPLPDVGNLDGLYLTLGPVGSFVRIEGEWTTAAGAEVSLVRVQERCLPAAYGIAAGGIGYTDRKGGRLWFEAEAALERPLPFAVGLAVGTTAEVDPVEPPRFGVQGTLYVFAGIIPYVRVGTMHLEGEFFEAGVMIKIPALHY